jgi:hypothetical protein
MLTQYQVREERVLRPFDSKQGRLLTWVVLLPEGFVDEAVG